MKTTIDIPDVLFRRAKARAAERGIALREFVAEALEARLADGVAGGAREPPWMEGFGKLKGLHRETARIQRTIDTDLGAIEAEDRL